jgi:hypothetical protein
MRGSPRGQCGATTGPRPVVSTDIWLELESRLRQTYRKFVSAGRGVTVWGNLRGQICLGGNTFIEQHVPAGTAIAEIPRAQRTAGRPPLASIVSDSHDAAGVARAYLECGYSQ